MEQEKKESNTKEGKNLHNITKGGKKVLGCIGKTFAFLLLLFMVRACGHCVGKFAQKHKAQETSELISEDASQEECYLMLKENVEDVKSTLPKPIMGDDIIYEDLVLMKSTLEIHYEVNDTLYAEIRNEVLSKSAQMNNWKDQYNDMRPMINLLVKAHCGIAYVYKCRNSGKTEKVVIPYTDLAKLGY